VVCTSCLQALRKEIRSNAGSCHPPIIRSNDPTWVPYVILIEPRCSMKNPPPVPQPCDACLKSLLMACSCIPRVLELCPQLRFGARCPLSCCTPPCVLFVLQANFKLLWICVFQFSVVPALYASAISFNESLRAWCNCWLLP
jgi:hypothetical protein